MTTMQALNRTKEADMGDGSAIWMVGCVRTDRLALPHPMSDRDLVADRRFGQRVFETLGVTAGSTVLQSSGSAEYAQFWPYEEALESLEACIALAENLPFDAGRSEMFLRRLSIDVAFGVGLPLLNGMQAMGFDLGQVYSQARTIVARDGAADLLKAAGHAPWRMVSFGPAFAYVSPDGESFHDETEWLLESPAGEILISARHARANPLVRFPTGVRGTVDAKGCLQLD